jgi:hypothetical protein
MVVLAVDNKRKKGNVPQFHRRSHNVFSLRVFISAQGLLTPVLTAVNFWAISVSLTSSSLLARKSGT